MEGSSLDEVGLLFGLLITEATFPLSSILNLELEVMSFWLVRSSRSLMQSVKVIRALLMGGNSSLTKAIMLEFVLDFKSANRLILDKLN